MANRLLELVDTFRAKMAERSARRAEKKAAQEALEKGSGRGGHDFEAGAGSSAQARRGPNQSYDVAPQGTRDISVPGTPAQRSVTPYTPPPQEPIDLEFLGRSGGGPVPGIAGPKVEKPATPAPNAGKTPDPTPAPEPKGDGGAGGGKPPVDDKPKSGGKDDDDVSRGRGGGRRKDKDNGDSVTLPDGTILKGKAAERYLEKLTKEPPTRSEKIRSFATTTAIVGGLGLAGIGAVALGPTIYDVATGNKPEGSGLIQTKVRAMHEGAERDSDLRKKEGDEATADAKIASHATSGIQRVSTSADHVKKVDLYAVSFTSRLFPNDAATQSCIRDGFVGGASQAFKAADFTTDDKKFKEWRNAFSSAVTGNITNCPLSPVETIEIQRKIARVVETFNPERN